MVVPLVKDGVVTNHVRYVPQSNESVLKGAIFDRSTMSLRALLSNGIQLTYVSDPNTADLISVDNRIHSIANAITSRYASLLQQESADVESESNS